MPAKRAPEAAVSQEPRKGTREGDGGDLSGLQVLLAEDHEINRRLCLMMLANLGAAADVACNGLEAVAAVKAKRYDLILMDCSMPKMDGYQATRAIRQLESTLPEGGRKRAWIVALTANALVGERERCLEAGMDDYLAKPFTVAELQAAAGALSASGARSEVPRGAAASLNSARLTEVTAELGEAVVRPMVEDFLKELPERLADFGRMAQTGDWKNAEFGAHSLKGVSTVLGFDELTTKLLELERGAENRNAPAMTGILAELEQCRRAAAEAFDRWLRQQPG